MGWLVRDQGYCGSRNTRQAHGQNLTTNAHEASYWSPRRGLHQNAKTPLIRARIKLAWGLSGEVEVDGRCVFEDAVRPFDDQGDAVGVPT
jgi:hypothetical protein